MCSFHLESSRRKRKGKYPMSDQALPPKVSEGVYCGTLHWGRALPLWMRLTPVRTDSCGADEGRMQVVCFFQIGTRTADLRGEYTNGTVSLHDGECNTSFSFLPCNGEVSSELAIGWTHNNKITVEYNPQMSNAMRMCDENDVRAQFRRHMMPVIEAAQSKCDDALVRGFRLPPFITLCAQYLTKLWQREFYYIESGVLQPRLRGRLLGCLNYDVVWQITTFAGGIIPQLQYRTRNTWGYSGGEGPTLEFVEIAGSRLGSGGIAVMVGRGVC